MCSPFRKLGLYFVLLLAFSLILPSVALAQNRGFGGKVVNDKGEPVIGAIITIRGTNSARLYTTKTDKKGDWVYMNLAIGTYFIVVRADGYAPVYDQKDAAVGMATVTFKPLVAGDSSLKFPFEMTPEEQEKLKQEEAKAKEQAKMYGEIKANFEAGRALADQGKFTEAIAEYQKALEKAPNEPTVLANLADAQSKAGLNQESADNYKKAIDLKPDDAALWINYGTVLNNLGKTAESKEAFQKAATLNPGAKGQSLYNLGVTQMNAGQTKDAAETFRQAIAADPNYAEAYFRLGQLLLSDQATMAEAVKTLEKYIQIGKDATNVQIAKDIVAALKK
ncbi:MAG: tetratricopeptide repeat protein [Acidobacteriota bacterium]|jgi:tetratricopeptide (TPR) repeat protein